MRHKIGDRKPIVVQFEILMQYQIPVSHSSIALADRRHSCISVILSLHPNLIGIPEPPRAKPCAGCDIEIYIGIYLPDSLALIRNGLHHSPSGINTYRVTMTCIITQKLYSIPFEKRYSLVFDKIRCAFFE